MEAWNVLVTCLMGSERTVFEELKALGKFKKANFKDVYAGKVENLEVFFEALQKNIFLLPNIGKAVPIEKTFSFHLEEFEELLKKSLIDYLPRLENHSFYVRIERRGFKGKINSLSEEKILDQFLLEELRKQGREGRIDFENPDYIVAVETLGDRCGVSLISRELKAKYPAIKIH